jgi:hypothetical protein
MEVQYQIPKKVQLIQAHRQDSAFKWEGDPDEKRINTSAYQNILSEDECVLTKEVVDYYNKLNGSVHLVIDSNEVVKTQDGVVIGTLGDMAKKRFIKNYTSIWFAEQEARKVKPTEAVPKMWDINRPLPGDSIFLQDGNLWVDIKTNKKDKGLFLHVMMHNQNADYPYRDDSIAYATFKINNLQRAAELDIINEDAKKEASDKIWELRDVKSKKFDSDKLKWYTKIFKAELGGLETEEEIFRALLRIAGERPDVINNSVDEGRTPYIAAVQTALDLGLISRGRGNMVNHKTGNVIITISPRMSQHDIIEKLVSHFIADEGAAEFDHLKKMIEAEKK